MAQSASEHPRVHLIVMATDPSSNAGGIATSLPGFFELLKETGLHSSFLPTHAAHKANGKWKPFLNALRALRREVREARSNGRRPVAWMQVGGPVSSLRKSLLAAALRLQGVQVITQLHSARVETYLTRSRGKRLFFATLALSSMVVVLTPWWKRLLQEHGLRRPLAVLPNVLSHEMQAVAAQPKYGNTTKADATSDGGLRVLTMSRMVSGKGFELVIDAMTSCDRSVTLEVAGDGPLRGDLERRVKDLRLQDRVRFSGWIDHEAKAAALRACDVFCLPSSYDSFGMGFIEAMAYGRPVVALSTGPTSDVVPDGRCGLLVPPGDPEAVARALERLRLDIVQRQSMGEAARTWVLETYSQEALKPQIRAILGALNVSNN
jgi:glycosyltransferase involved in cell wall biosynthesis